MLVAEKTKNPASAGREVALAASAAAQLAAALPNKSPQEIVEDLLHRLGHRRTLRDRKGLNHWAEYCPRYLDRLVARHRTGDFLREAVRFIIVNHDSAVEFATRITCDADMAETAVSQTYVELLKRRTKVKFFYHALKMNARDLLQARGREMQRFDSLDGLLSAAARRQNLSAAETQSDYSEAIDFTSTRLDDQDPLDVLIARQERQERSDELERAIRDVRRTRDNRRILDADWWKESALSEWEKSDWERRQGGKTRGCGE